MICLHFVFCSAWYWKCMLKPWGLKVVSVCLCIFSIMVVWSEVLFFVPQPTLSLFAIFINLAKNNYEYFYIEVRQQDILLLKLTQSTKTSNTDPGCFCLTDLDSPEILMNELFLF